jgi:hypothetical protein
VALGSSARGMIRGEKVTSLAAIGSSSEVMCCYEGDMSMTASCMHCIHVSISLMQATYTIITKNRNAAL